MATATETTKTANEKALEAITSIQGRIVDAHKGFASTVAGLVPEVPSWVPTPDLSDAPDAKELVEESFAFQSRLLEANKSFSLALVDAWSQAVPSTEPATKPSTKK